MRHSIAKKGRVRFAAKTDSCSGPVRQLHNSGILAAGAQLTTPADGADKVGRVHLAEALSYRALADEIRRAA
jgi:hypothetical protein